MSKPKNENNVYQFTCKVTGETIHTNPKQFRDTMHRYGVTREVLQDNYVGRKGRNQIAAEKLTVQEAMDKYGIVFEVASRLKATIKPAPPASAAPAVEVPENAKEVAPEASEQTAEGTKEVFYDASKEEEAETALATA